MEAQNDTKQPSFVQAIDNHESYGRVATLILPSGNQVVIREQNGHDDDILSSFGKNDLDTAAINRFIAGIIVKNSFPWSKSQTKITEKEVLNILLNDKYFILVASRAFSLGEEFTFPWDWGGDVGKVDYGEDVTQYLWDYTKEFPLEGDENYFKYRIKPYYDLDDGLIRELTLKTGKKVRYKYLDGHSENFLLKKTPEQRTINITLKARSFSYFDNASEKWVEPNNFSVFNPKEMSEIRKDVREFDSQFDGFTDIAHPESGEIMNIPLVSISDFFFPREI